MVKAVLECISETPRFEAVYLKPLTQMENAPDEPESNNYSQCVICTIKSVMSQMKGTPHIKTACGRHCPKNNCVNFSMLARRMIS
jgi:hypothetical protein